MTKSPQAPAPRKQTVRQKLLSELEQGAFLSAKDLSQRARISEKEVFDHLDHIRRSLDKNDDFELAIVAAECRRCGFAFEERKKLRKPSRCPECRGESIEDPLFAVRHQEDPNISLSGESYPQVPEDTEGTEDTDSTEDTPNNPED